MTLVIALIFVLIIVNNIWMERRIRGLERRWNEFVDQHQLLPGSRGQK
jgi:hypothetical protein